MRAKAIEELRPALIAVGFFLMAARVLGFSLSPATLLAGFFAAFAIYFADHELPKASTIAWPGIILASTLFVFFAWQSGQLSWGVITLYGLLSFAYVFRWFPGNRRLQDFPKLRVLAISAGWGALPLLQKEFSLDAFSLMYIMGMAAFMVPAILWSDVADAESDQTAGRQTLAMHLTARERTVLIVCALAFSIFSFSLPQIYFMIPGPLIYLFLFRLLNRYPHHSDWVLLWPLFGTLLAKVI